MISPRELTSTMAYFCCFLKKKTKQACSVAQQQRSSSKNSFVTAVFFFFQMLIIIKELKLILTLHGYYSQEAKVTVALSPFSFYNHFL
jgi:hypothetical protein